jgi:NDP-mannose synthase
MKAIILAGGRGERLAPYTTILPKPLMPVGDKPILDLIARQLKHHGITELTFAVGHLAELVMSYFKDGSRLGVRIVYSREEEPLGTAGPIKLIQDPGERFLVMNGDVLTTLDFTGMIAAHEASGASATMSVCRRSLPVNFGVVKFAKDRHLTAYIEKPTYDVWVSMGIYVLERRVVDFIPAGKTFDLPDLMQSLMQAGEQVHCYHFEDYWLDIGRPDDHAKAVADIQQIEPLLFR